jgi:hypothetical protein
MCPTITRATAPPTATATAYTDPNVSVGTCTTSVANQALPGGATFNDLLAQAAAAARNHGAPARGRTAWTEPSVMW